MTERPAGRHALLFIFITVLIEMAGFGLIMPVMPDLIMDLTGEGVGRAAIYGGAMLFLYAGLQFFLAPVVGGLSDRFGRRPVLLLALGGYAIDYFLMGFAPVLAWLFVGRAIAGIFGASYSAAGAYIADISPPEKRAANFGLLGAAFGLGFIVGPVVGGYLGDWFGPRAPFFGAGILAGVNLIYGYFVLPETLPPSKRRAFDWRRANPVGSLAQMRLYPAVVGLLAATMLYQIAHRVYPAIWSYFAIERFEWTKSDIGLSLGAVGIASVIVQGGLTRIIIPRIGEARATYAGLLIAAIAGVGFAVAPNGWAVYALIPVSGLAGLAGPAMQGLMSNRVPNDGQGELAGAVASLNSLSAVVGPPALTWLFGAFTSEGAPFYFPGAPFVAAGALALAAVAVAAWALRRHAEREAPAREPVGEEATPAA
jgi:DHA1 family tetracycline resistance protein-like MFS transporter